MSEILTPVIELAAAPSELKAPASEPVPLASPPASAAPSSAEPALESPPSPVPADDQRASLLALVSNARDLPPGVRERLTRLVEQSSTLDDGGEPLLAARGVLDLLAQGLPTVLRRETPAAISRPEHPAGNTFFAVSGDELSEQQAEQIARAQLQRAGLLRPEK